MPIESCLKRVNICLCQHILRASTSIVVNNKAKCQPEKPFYDCRDHLRLSMSDIKLYYFLLRGLRCHFVLHQKFIFYTTRRYCWCIDIIIYLFTNFRMGEEPVNNFV